MEINDYLNNKQLLQNSYHTLGAYIEVLNPANDKVIGIVPNFTNEEIMDSIDAAAGGYIKWSKSSIDERVKIIKKWHDLLYTNIEDLAHIITIEQGKTIKDAKQEILYAISFMDWFSANVYNVQGSIKQGNNTNQKIITEYEPLGVVAAITPWNFPSAMVVRKVVPAILAGCTVILKPSELTPFSSIALCNLAKKAGLLGSVFNIITGEPSNIGKLLCKDFRVRKLSFTGSTDIGKELYKNSTSTLKRVSLELGGNSPFIVFKDANIEKASDELLNIKIRSSGQSCTAPNRIFLEKDIYEEFINIFMPKFSKLKAGSGLDSNTDIAPLINKNAVNKIMRLIEDATKKGAKILCGGNSVGNYIEGTVLTDCNDDMEVFNTEIFGPVVAFYRFESTEEVILRANNTNYGLLSYIYTKDLTLASYMKEKLDCGIVTFNNAFASNCRATFAGRKLSGFGIEGGDEGIFEYLTTKYVNWNIN